ncbi:MAG: hypothetical protein ACI4M6_03300 [Christensenellaceae bacterium]
MSDKLLNDKSGTTPDLTQLKIDRLLKRRKIFKITLIAVVLVTLIACIGTFFINLADKNSYDISVSGGNGSLTLSFDPEFKTGYTVITARGADKMEADNGGTYSEIESCIDAVVSGEIAMNVTKNGKEGKLQNGGSDEYSIAKLYLKNQTMSGEDIRYKLKINVYDNKREAFSAARIMVIRLDGDKAEKTVYAQPDDYGMNEKVAAAFRGSDAYYKDSNGMDWLCENFRKDQSGNWYYDSLEMQKTTYRLKPQEIQPIVIAVWYEGSDKNHSDEIVGGSYSLSVTFETVNA